MKQLTAILLSISFLMPVFSYANDENTLAGLEKQISLLVELVVSLQQQLLGVQSFNTEVVSDEEIRMILTDGVTWFKNAQEDNGHMRYEFVPYDDEYLPLDNIVRQAGSLYALGEILRYDEQDEYDLKETIEEQIGFFEELSTPGSANGKSFRCVSNSQFNDSCQLGATSLALIGVLAYVERYPDADQRYHDLVEDYANYHIAMKKEGTGFRSHFLNQSPLTDKENSFSNGEAMLALIRYYRHNPTDEVKTILEETFTYFESDAVEFDFPLYLWVMAALKDFEGIVSEERILTYTDAYTSWRVNGFTHRKGSTHNMCAYTEGLASAMAVLGENTNNLKLYQSELDYWHQHLRSLQISENDTYRIVYDEEGNARFGEMKRPELGVGGFLTNHNTPTQRIDYTQHCLNSYLQELVLLRRESL